MEECRNAERFSIEVESKITYRHKESPVIETVSGNISSNGALLKSDHIFPLASKIQIDFYLDLENLNKLKFILPVKSILLLAENKQLWVSISAVVVRQNDEGVAVVFGENYTIFPVS
ncbi:MAG: PilZ domain-containing protein [Desulfotalea sp.]